MVLFQTGYNRVPNSLNIMGPSKDWISKDQISKDTTVENIDLNKQLQEIKKKYLKVASDWENEGRS